MSKENETRLVSIQRVQYDPQLKTAFKFFNFIVVNGVALGTPLGFRCAFHLMANVAKRVMDEDKGNVGPQSYDVARLQKIEQYIEQRFAASTTAMCKLLRTLETKDVDLAAVNVSGFLKEHSVVLWRSRIIDLISAPNVPSISQMVERNKTAFKSRKFIEELRLMGTIDDSGKTSVFWIICVPATDAHTIPPIYDVSDLTGSVRVAMYVLLGAPHGMHFDFHVNM